MIDRQVAGSDGSTPLFLGMFENEIVTIPCFLSE